MHEARSTIDGRLYTAEKFALQPQAVKLAHRRRRFTCPVCQQPASFRSRSRDGRAACFTAQHTPGCEAASAVWTETPAPGVQAVPEVDNTGAVIVLDERNRPKGWVWTRNLRGEQARIGCSAQNEGANHG